MQLKTEAFVISSLRYADADLIVKLYTRKDGLNSYLLRGILKSKKGKIRTSFFQPLTLLEIDAIHSNKNSLNRLKDVKPITHYETLHTNIIKGSVITFISEILSHVLIENEPDEELFLFLKKATNWLDKNSNFNLFPQYILVQLSSFLGFYPDSTNDTLPQFNLEEGRFDVSSKSSLCIDQEELIHFKDILGTDFDSLSSLLIPKLGRLKLLENLLLYFSLHSEGFKRPKSLTVIQELFS